MDGDFAFCPECGTPTASAVSQPQEPQAQQTTQYYAPAPQQPQYQYQPQDNGQQPLFPPVQPDDFPPLTANLPRKPLSKAAIISIISGVVVILLVVGAYFLGKYMTDEDRLITKFEKMATEGDGEKLYKLLSASNEDIKLDQKTADAMAAYLKDNEDVVQDLVEELRSEATDLKSGDVETFSTEDDAPFVYLEKKVKKKWLLYNDYELKVKRYMIPVSSNFEGAQIVVNGEQAAGVEADGSAVEVGPLLPGNYEVKVVYEGEYTTLENKQNVSLFPMAEYDDEVLLDLQGDYVYVYSDNASAEIYINGKDIGLKADGNQEIGPIAMDGSNTMYVQAEYPWGSVKSEEQPVSSEEMSFHIDPLTDDVKEAIMTSSNDFVKNWMQATQEKNPALATNLNDYMLERMNNNLSSLEYYSEVYIGELTRMTYDLDSFQLYANGNDSYTASVKVREETNEATASMESDYELAPVTSDIQYLLEYQNGSWIITDAYTIYDFSTTNTKEY
ncbi:zinc ribbon domain-containing protein [Cohnella yongneupensis]|uniref:Zinc ribbon domain-containing protein n=1 Tax=Cohnella yongneupensis TaxID=425006 RepID=A0ABW0R2W8_9BACL